MTEQIDHVSETLIKYAYLMILENELSGHKELAYKFSDADGSSGRSGYSFGVSQFDIRFNAEGGRILRKIGFSEDRIKTLITQETKVTKQDNELLKNGAHIIDESDYEHIRKTIMKALKLVAKLGLGQFCSKNYIKTILPIVDYMNQFGDPTDGGTFENMLKKVLTAKNPSSDFLVNAIYEFKKNSTKYGRNNPKDVDRRHAGLIKAISTATESNELI